MQLFFLDLCFTALFFEEATPLTWQLCPFFFVVFLGGVEDAFWLCLGFLFRLGELDFVVYGGESCGEPLLGFLVVAEIELAQI